MHGGREDRQWKEGSEAVAIEGRWRIDGGEIVHDSEVLRKVI